MRIDTRCVHSGTIADEITGGLNTPIYPSSAFEYLDLEEAVYPRYFNTPNQKAVVEKLCELEGAEAGFVFSSGMAAISSVLLSFLKAGDHAVLQDEIYGGSHAFVQKFFQRFGIACTFAATSAQAMETAIRPETKVIFIETPTNPLLNVIDIRAVADVARRNNCISIIDSTFATPILQNPIEHGMDVVVHSGTKYLGGHSDLSCGAALTRSELASKIRAAVLNFGGNINALTCYLLERSLKTLAIRVRQQTENALALAKFLEDQPFVSKVNYPGLAHHPGHAVAGRQMKGFGAMLSFELDLHGSSPDLTVDGFLKNLKLVRPAVSLGGVESTICDPVRTSHAKMSPEARARQGIRDNLLRLSVGIENVEDLMEDISQAAGG
ncbi:MAG: PLP-dependent aspartate aminotransferase family protein [bacterium]|nr:PLP-dependent aspartate aminotransferase family protein [bacterium]